MDSHEVLNIFDTTFLLLYTTFEFINFQNNEEFCNLIPKLVFRT